MTAINIIRKKDSVHLISDGASYDAKQRLVSIGPKVFPLPHINAAIGIRGPTIALPLLAHLIGHAATSYDALKINIVEILSNAYANTRVVLEKGVTGSALNVVIGGFSETVGADAYVVVCDDDGMVSPLTQITDFGFMPSCPQITSFVQMQAAKHQWSKSAIDEIDAADFGLRTIEMQRALKFGDYNTCHVGGFAQITSIRPDGIETKLLRRWPDEIGSPLNDSILTAVSGVIGALSVNSLSIGDNAVTVPVSQTQTGVVGPTTGITVSSVTLTIDTTGLAGKTIPILASWTGELSYTGSGGNPAATLFIAGSAVQQVSVNNSQDSFITLTGSSSFTASGGVDTKVVSVNYASPATGNPTLSARTLWAMAAKRELSPILGDGRAGQAAAVSG
jgi:hypothetical protein